MFETKITVWYYVRINESIELMVHADEKHCGFSGCADYTLNGILSHFDGHCHSIWEGNIDLGTFPVGSGPALEKAWEVAKATLKDITGTWFSEESRYNLPNSRDDEDDEETGFRW